MSVPHAPSAERLVRLLRHEVGDLLQSVYAVVAALQTRLPAEATTERQLLGHLRSRGEKCRRLLDGVQELVCIGAPMSKAVAVLPLLKQEVAAYTQVTLQHEPGAPLHVWADAQHLAEIIRRLLACFAGRGPGAVRFQVAGDAAQAHWVLTDEGPPLPDEQLAMLDEGLPTHRPDPLILELAIIRRLVLLQEGCIRAINRPGGGLMVEVELPAASCAG